MSRRSWRAQARANYRERVAAQAACDSAGPLPNPAPQAGEGTDCAGGGEQAVRGGGDPPAPNGFGGQGLTARVRALYERSAVPVAEIARLCGVSERTIYKYAARHHWQPRYAWAGEASRPRVRAAGGGGRRPRAAPAGRRAPSSPRSRAPAPASSAAPTRANASRAA